MSMLAVERRHANDRRSRCTPALARLVRPGRRRRMRRREDGRDSYVDVYEETWLLAVALLTVLLSILDGYLTLVHLQHGGRELNPLVDVLIQTGWTPFIIVKAALSSICVVFLVIHKNFFMVKRLLVVVCVIYLALLFYHLYLRAL